MDPARSVLRFGGICARATLGSVADGCLFAVRRNPHRSRRAHHVNNEETATPQAPAPPEPLRSTWWSRSIFRAVLRRALGITQDVAAGEAFMRQVLTNIQLTARKMKDFHDRYQRLGSGVNEVASYAQEVER